MRSRLPTLLAAATYVVGLAVVGLWPSHVDENLDLVDRPPTTWLISAFDLTPVQGYRVGEFLANVLLFVPLGLFAAALLRRLSWLHVVLGGAVVSCLVETAQVTFRPGRTGSLSDVVANTLGAAVGALVVVGWRRWRPGPPAASGR